MRTRTIRTSMFFTYAIILITACIIYYTLFAVFVVQNVAKQTLATISQYSSTIGDAVDDQLEDLNMVTMNVAYSNIVKSTFAEYNNSYKTDESNYFNNTRMLGDLLIAIIGPNFPADQINLYSLDNGVFASGVDNGYYSNDIRSMSWYEEVMDKAGYKVINLPAWMTDSRDTITASTRSHLYLFSAFTTMFLIIRKALSRPRNLRILFSPVHSHTKPFTAKKYTSLILRAPWFTR